MGVEFFRAAQGSGRGRTSAGGIKPDVTFDPASKDVNDAVDDCREKYGRYTGCIEPMIAAQARATTLRLVRRETVPA